MRISYFRSSVKSVIPVKNKDTPNWNNSNPIAAGNSRNTSNALGLGDNVFQRCTRDVFACATQQNREQVPVMQLLLLAFLVHYDSY